MFNRGHGAGHGLDALHVCHVAELAGLLATLKTTSDSAARVSTNHLTAKNQNSGKKGREEGGGES